MCIRMFFHKIKLWQIRNKALPFPYLSEAKQYGNDSEDALVYLLQSSLPNCKIKQNVLITTPEGNAEIDLIILYNNSLFAIEVKHWKGELFECDDGIIQHKTDHWTGETYSKHHKSPFKQLNRAIFLLHKQIPYKAWINAIVYFDSADNISLTNEYTWFSDIESLLDNITNTSKLKHYGKPETFFEKCISSDIIYSDSRNQVLRCNISNDSLCFKTEKGILTRKDIKQVHIKHHWSYDELFIQTKKFGEIKTKTENASITVINNGSAYTIPLCKLRLIRLRT